MNRNQMIDKLKSLYFFAEPTCMTFDMGIQYDIATTIGYSTCFGLFESWPLHKIKPIDTSLLTRIKESIRTRTIRKEDLIGTDLYNLVEDFINFYLEINEEESSDMNEEDLSNILSNILEIPDNFQSSFFCLFDCYSVDDIPSFYLTKQDAEQAFLEEYGLDDIHKWEEMNDLELNQWVNRIEKGTFFNEY